MQFTLLSAAAILAFVASSNAQAGPWGQCGGGSVGNIGCMSGWCCQYQNEWYSQCLQSCTGGSSSTTSSKTSTTLSKTTTSSSKTTTKAITTTAVVTTTTSKAVTAITSASGGGSTDGAAPVDQLVGFGAGTTGAGSGAGVTVTSCSALSAAVANAGVIKISGILSGCGVIDLKGSTTVLGVGSNSGMTRGGFRARKVSNVIIRNLKFYLAQQGDDLVALDQATQVWIDHNEFYNAGIVGDKDYYDGLLDITHASDFVTVSWNKFHDHWKGSLVGHSDSNAAEDTGKLHVTYHHNSWNNVNSRLPSLRFGTSHIYSSCFTNAPTSGINSRMGASIFVESNSFTNVLLAIVTDLDSDEAGCANQKNNLFLGTSTTRITQTNSYTPSYSYKIDAASTVCSIVGSKAGTGIVG